MIPQRVRDARTLLVRFAVFYTVLPLALVVALVLLATISEGAVIVGVLAMMAAMIVPPVLWGRRLQDAQQVTSAWRRVEEETIARELRREVREQEAREIYNRPPLARRIF